MDTTVTLHIPDVVGPLIYITLEMWVNAQHDGRPAERRWRPPFNATVWLTLTTLTITLGIGPRSSLSLLPAWWLFFWIFSSSLISPCLY